MEKHNLLFSGLFVLASIIYVSQSARITYDISDFPAHPLKIDSNYTPRGDEYDLGNLTVYESQNRAAKRVLILIFDILGMSVNLKQVADTLAEQYDFRVVMPAFFRNPYWNETNFPPEDPQDVVDWIEENASWDKVVKYDLATVINAFQSRDNISEVGVFGMCYGGLMSTLAAIETSEIKAAAIVHPTYVDNSYADAIQRPMYLLPASNDPDLLPTYEVLTQKFGNNSGHRRFDDMLHGFAGSGANFSNPLIVQRVQEVIDILGGFFGRNLNNY